MSVEQLKSLTVTVTNGSPTITGSGNSWLTDLAAGYWFSKQDTSSVQTVYRVSSVDGDNQVTLESNWAGASGSITAFFQRSFTPNYHIPSPQPGDAGWGDLLAEALSIIDSNMLGSLSPAPSDGGYSGITCELTAGETVAFSNTGYIKSDGKVWKSDADTSTKMPVRVMIIDAGVADGTITCLIKGFIRNSSWSWTKGVSLFANSSGTLTEIPPSGDTDIVQGIGWALTSDIIFFNPDNIYVEMQS